MIKRISHGLWLDMIYIQLIECFLSPRQGSGIENTQLIGWKSYPTTNHGRSYYRVYKYWLHERVNFYPKKKNLDRGKAKVDIGFRGVTIFPFTISCSQYLLIYMLIKYIVYITSGFKTIQVKWIFEFVFRIS